MLSLTAACLLAASPRPQASLTLERPASCAPGVVSPACPLQANNDVLAEDENKVDSYSSEADIPAPTASVAQPFYPAPVAASGPVATGTAYSEECAHYSATDSSSVDNAWCELNCPAKNCPEAMCQCKKAEEVRKIKEVKRSESSAATDAKPPDATDATPPAAPCKQGEVSPACPMHANNDVAADDGEYADDEEAVYNPRDDALENDWRTAAKRQHQKDQAKRAKDRAALKRQKEEAKRARELERHPELAPPIKQ